MINNKNNHCTDSSLLLALTSVSSLLVIPLLSYRLGVSDFVIGILAVLSLVSASVGAAFSRTGTHYIIGKPGGRRERERVMLMFSQLCWFAGPPGLHSHQVPAV